MKKKFAKDWKRSKQPRKQIKYRHHAPLHIKNKFLSAHLSKELRLKLKRRSLALKKGDKVKILRGKFRGKTGVIDGIDLKRSRTYISGVDVMKKDGSKTNYPINPSNVLITELDIEDKMRKKSLERKK